MLDYGHHVAGIENAHRRVADHLVRSRRGGESLGNPYRLVIAPMGR
jgi:hypothetical protein